MDTVTLVMPCQCCFKGGRAATWGPNAQPNQPQLWLCDRCFDEYVALTREAGVPREIQLSPSFVTRLRSALHRVASLWF